LIEFYPNEGFILKEYNDSGFTVQLIIDGISSAEYISSVWKHCWRRRAEIFLTKIL